MKQCDSRHARQSRTRHRQGDSLSAVHVKIDLMSRPTPRQPAAAVARFFRADRSMAPAKAAGIAAAAGPAGPGAGPATGTPADAGPASPYVVDVDEATFGSLLQASSQVLVVVDLWAAWSEPGKQLSAILQRLAAAAGGSWILARVDVDANPRIAQAFAVQSLPMVVALAQGQPITEPLTTVLAEPQVRQWISALLDALRDHLPGIREAEAAAGQPAVAVADEPEPEDPRFV